MVTVFWEDPTALRVVVLNTVMGLGVWLFAVMVVLAMVKVAVGLRVIVVLAMVTTDFPLEGLVPEAFAVIVVFATVTF